MFNNHPGMIGRAVALFLINATLSEQMFPVEDTQGKPFVPPSVTQASPGLRNTAPTGLKDSAIF
jgi:hypothetical protein